jgi:hypothetical protein
MQATDRVRILTGPENSFFFWEQERKGGKGLLANLNLISK